MSAEEDVDRDSAATEADDDETTTCATLPPLFTFPTQAGNAFEQTFVIPDDYLQGDLGAYPSLEALVGGGGLEDSLSSNPITAKAI